MDTKNDDKASFHEIAIVYDRFAKSASSPKYSPGSDEKFDFEWLNNQLISQPTKKPILDIGCGSETVAAQLNLDDGLLIGIDLSEEMIGLARKNNPQHAFYVMNGQSLRFGDNSIGGAVAYFSLIHLSEVQLGRVLREVNRVLEPGAPFLLTVYGAQDAPTSKPTNELGLAIHSHREDRIRGLMEGLDCFSLTEIARRPAREGEQPYEHLFIRAANNP